VRDHTTLVRAKCGCGFSADGRYDFNKGRFVIEHVSFFPCDLPDCDARREVRRRAKHNGWSITEPTPKKAMKRIAAATATSKEGTKA
jgi:hypothetical protein